jgi:hypothetical protein
MEVSDELHIPAALPPVGGVPAYLNKGPSEHKPDMLPICNQHTLDAFTWLSLLTENTFIILISNIASPTFN